MKENQEKYTKISELRPRQKNVNCVFIVLEKGQINTKTKDNHNITHTLVADQTASIHLSLWDDVGEVIQPGDLIRLCGGYTSLFKNSLILYVGKYGSIQRIGEKVFYLLLFFF
eukprot:TRINITY_DN740_c0_g1_i3.p1 TRINITY_DN740_c0_g1~~TRINITY_DN740_c0_g1_i3.p1  ORF type:complete len:113 (-),score=6.41 TRINITY_DN740_c0_g1_i3:166-504(-)